MMSQACATAPAMSGLVLADRHVSRRYVREEHAARRAGIGIWKQVGTQVSMLP